MSETADQIAARLGVALCPGVAVTRVPRGATGLPQPVWDGKELVIEGYKDYLKRSLAAQARANRIGFRDRARAPVVDAKSALLARIAEMVSLGHDRPAIAGEVGLSVPSLVALAHWNKITLPPPSPRKSRAKPVGAPAVAVSRGGRPRGTGCPAVAARRAQVRDMWAAGMAGPAIAAALGVSLSVAQNDVSRMRRAGLLDVVDRPVGKRRAA